MCAVLPAIATGLSLFSGLAMRNAAQQQARQTYQTEVENVRRADEAANRQATAEGERLKATRASEAQKTQQISLAGRRARGAIRAAEGRSGNVMTALLMDEGRKTGNQINSINQSIESFARQSGRRVQGIYAQRDQRRASSQSNVNQAYSKVPSLTATLLGAGSSALPFVEV